MRRYVHIGAPKCASTALQNQFFATHPSLHHLGSGYRGDTGKYADGGVARLVESGLRFQKEFLWDPEAAREVLAGHADEAAAAGRQAVGLSSEFLGFTLGNEIDVAAKARRLREVMGEDTCVVLVFREQASLLRSLYTELVKGGYPGTYRNFLEYTWLYQDRNWCLDFCFDRLLDCYRDLFGRDNVVALPLEWLEQDPAAFQNALCNGIGAGEHHVKLHARNVRPPLEELELLRRFNEKWPRELGSPFFKPFHSERLRAWFEDELQVRVPMERALDDGMRATFESAAREQAARHEVPPLDLEAPEGLAARLRALYAPSNRQLAEMVDFDLSAYGYPLD